jgi:phospholipid N-methyltransferase
MNRLTDYQTFLTQFLRNQEKTGALIPSSRALGSSLCRYVGGSTGPQKILEAGPGTGAVTGCIIERMRREDELWMVELNPVFAAHLRAAFAGRPAFRDVASRCHLVEGSIQELGHVAEFDLVVSGLPLNNFSSRGVRDILQAYSRLLKPASSRSFSHDAPAGEMIVTSAPARPAERRRRSHRAYSAGASSPAIECGRTSPAWVPYPVLTIVRAKAEREPANEPCAPARQHKIYSWPPPHRSGQPFRQLRLLHQLLERFPSCRQQIGLFDGCARRYAGISLTNTSFGEAAARGVEKRRLVGDCFADDTIARLRRDDIGARTDPHAAGRCRRAGLRRCGFGRWLDPVTATDDRSTIVCAGGASAAVSSPSTP